MSKPKIVLKKLKELDTIWHPESTLVFKSQLDKVVIGRYADKKFIEFDETSLSLCIDWNFKYDKNLVDETSEEETSEDFKSKNVCNDGNETETQSADPSADLCEQILDEVKHISENTDKKSEDKLPEQCDVKSSMGSSHVSVEEPYDTFNAQTTVNKYENMPKTSFQLDYEKEVDNVLAVKDNISENLDIEKLEVLKNASFQNLNHYVECSTNIIINLNKKILFLENNSKHLRHDLDSCQDQYNSLKNKFDQMKKLFS